MLTTNHGSASKHHYDKKLKEELSNHIDQLTSNITCSQKARSIPHHLETTKHENKACESQKYNIFKKELSTHKIAKRKKGFHSGSGPVHGTIKEGQGINGFHTVVDVSPGDRLLPPLQCELVGFLHQALHKEFLREGKPLFSCLKKVILRPISAHIVITERKRRP